MLRPDEGSSGEFTELAVTAPALSHVHCCDSGDKARLTSPAAALDPSPHAPRGPPACRLCRPGSPAVSTSCGGVMGLCRGLCGTMSSPVQRVHDAQMSATLARKRSREQREKAGNAATKSS